MSGSARLFDWLLIIGFLLVIGTPGLLHLVTPDDPASVLAERRRPEPLPPWPSSVAELEAWPARFERYHADSFRFRRVFVRAYNTIKLLGLGVAPQPGVVVGPGTWLFFTGNRTVEKHLGLAPFGPKRVARYARILDERRQWLETRGAAYLFVVAPDKHGIYPEHLPSYLHAVSDVTPLDQLVAALSPQVAPCFLDLRGAVRRGKDDHLLYFPRGTHWNGMGAYLGYREVACRLGVWFEGMAPTPLGDFDVRLIRARGDNWGEQFHMEDLLTQEVWLLTAKHPVATAVTRVGLKGPRDRVTVTAGSSGPRALVFHDSFVELMRDLLVPHFSEITWIWDTTFDRALVDAILPDVVIQLTAERNLDRSPFEAERPASAAEVAAEVDAIVGTYANPVHGALRIERAGEGIALVTDSSRELADRVGRDCFGGRREDFRLARWFAIRRDDGPATRVEIFEKRVGFRTAFLRVAPDSPTSPWSGYAGAYVWETFGCHIVADGPRLVVFDDAGGFLGELRPRDDGTFRVEGVRTFLIRFDLADGEVEGVTVWMAGRELRGRRVR